MREFDNKGNLILSISDNNVVMLTKDPQGSMPITKSNAEVDPVTVGSFKAIPWYDDNNFPQAADLLIKNTPVLKRSLTDLCKITLGQGVFPCLVNDTLPNGQEVLKMIKDPLITAQMQSYKMRRYIANTLYDLYTYGNAWVQLVPNVEGTKILTLNPVSALKCRNEMFDNNGNVKNVLVSGYWPDAEQKNTKKYLLLDEIDPIAHLEELKTNGGLKNTTVFMQLKNSWSSNDNYAMPNWYTALEWVNISKKVPKFINAGMDNMLNIFFLVKIPYSYWEKKYPRDQFESDRERLAKIEADVTMLETKFTTVENARKALITHFDSENGGEKWEIEIIQPKFSEEQLKHSSAADTQIAIAAGMSPDLLGLMYGNSKGGSMQRELLLLQYALSWQEREQAAEPIEMMLKFNGADPNLQIRYRNTFLTTLDTGAGTATTLS
jgi:hypothetical protein